ncbi:MraY family glycosyltransferase [Fulvivirga lutimaris]|uniref:MraY family glycosyltransferase n=1 Tax=Fulvivirga lutimaris TaxID=1819566 RepID=UPI0012BD50A1|nr:MraY family glycosyltransferase [Fulvivirga lutimaris]MTI39823.1 undecaprenyl/decaprenyl-phosphate alpha-N-acetylglucosaminyl 1-phosphate transferase [Fulvivirga lutimaris]
MSSEDATMNKYLFSSLALFFVIGLRDDIIPMKPFYKLIGQLVPIILIILLGHVRLESFYDIGNINFSASFSLVITIFVIIVITNSINLIDGIDGLAGSLSLTSLLVLGSWFYLTNDTDLAFISFTFVGAIMAFLVYNWSPSKIFMGDTGALLIGFLLSALVIHFINKNFELDNNSAFKFSASISTAMCFIIVPLTDTLRVFIIRLTKFKSPLIADNNHIHHSLLRLGLKHSSISVLLAAINILFIVLAIILKGLSDVFVLPIVLSLVGILLGLLHYYELKSQAEKA